MAVDASGRVLQLSAVQLLHPEEQTLEDMLTGWRNQQLSRNLQFDTIDKGIASVRRFVNHVNEFPWNCAPEHVEEYHPDHLEAYQRVRDLQGLGDHGPQCLRIRSVGDVQVFPVDEPVWTGGIGRASSERGRGRLEHFMDSHSDSVFPARVVSEAGPPAHRGAVRINTCSTLGVLSQQVGYIC